MGTHNIYVHGEIKTYQYFSAEKSALSAVGDKGTFFSNYGSSAFVFMQKNKTIHVDMAFN